MGLFFFVVRHTRGFWEHLQFWEPELALLGAMLAVALVACPLLAAVGLRAAVES